MDRRLQDCYFYYYSTCTKGEHCGFRHEQSALGSETVCQFWQQGKCTNVKCNLRHMEIKKNRKNIPCFWESQPTGCRKPHCSFLHQAQRKASPPTSLPNETKDCAVPSPATSVPRSCEQPAPEAIIVSFQERMHLY